MEKAQSSNQTLLAPAVIEQILRLGGVFSPQTTAGQMAINGFIVPEPIRQFLFDVAWPEQVTFKNTDDQDIWVWMYTPGYFDMNSRDEYPYFPRHPDSVFIGDADGGNYLLLVHLTSETPADPLVYKLDHDSFEEEDEPTGPMPLSAFLASLEPEER